MVAQRRELVLMARLLLFGNVGYSCAALDGLSYSGLHRCCTCSSVSRPDSQLPKGPAPKAAASKSLNPFSRYKQRYFSAGNESGAPILHAIFGEWQAWIARGSAGQGWSRGQLGETRCSCNHPHHPGIFLIGYTIDYQTHLKHHKVGLPIVSPESCASQADFGPFLRLAEQHPPLDGCAGCSLTSCKARHRGSVLRERASSAYPHLVGTATGRLPHPATVGHF